MANYELLRYEPLTKQKLIPPRLVDWGIYYRVPGELIQRVVFARAAEMTDEIAKQAIEAHIAAYPIGSRP